MVAKFEVHKVNPGNTNSVNGWHMNFKPVREVKLKQAKPQSYKNHEKFI